MVHHRQNLASNIQGSPNCCFESLLTSENIIARQCSFSIFIVTNATGSEIDHSEATQHVLKVTELIKFHCPHS